MKTVTEASPIDRYIAIDIHKHYVLLGGMNAQKEWVLRTRKVRMSRFPEWVLEKSQTHRCGRHRIDFQCLGDLRLDRTYRGQDCCCQSPEGWANRRCQGQDRPPRC